MFRPDKVAADFLNIMSAKSREIELVPRYKFREVLYATDNRICCVQTLLF